MARSERVMVISLQKSGTHLIQQVMIALGYGMYGSSRIAPEMRPTFDRTQRLAIARQVLDDDDYITLAQSDDPVEFEHKTNAAWGELGWYWQKRLGVPIFNRYGNAHQEWIGEISKKRRLDHARFADTPRNVCWILHDLELRIVDGDFLDEWSRTNEPKIILNYRDPRDVILSFVNYLSNETGRGFGVFHEFKVFSKILSGMGSLDEKLSYALRDRSFPGHGDLERAYWMVRHPNVCKVSFEELVGPAGGGSSECQHSAIERIMNHLSIPVSKDEVVRVSDAAYNRRAFTFYKGQCASWKSVYRRQHLDLFKSEFGDILSYYGYT